MRTLAHVFVLAPESLWLFTTRDDVEPTNNLAERDLRPLVMWRKMRCGSIGQSIASGLLTDPLDTRGAGVATAPPRRRAAVERTDLTHLGDELGEELVPRALVLDEDDPATSSSDLRAISRATNIILNPYTVRITAAWPVDLSDFLRHSFPDIVVPTHRK
jgi:hypothetical protein